MPITNSATTVGTAVTEISGPSINAKIVYVQDGQYNDQTQVWVGGASVTPETGIKLSKINVSVFQLNADDSLYAIGDGAASSVRVTEIR